MGWGSHVFFFIHLFVSKALCATLFCMKSAIHIKFDCFQAYQVGHWVSKLCIELINKTLDQPIAVDRIIYDLLHGSTDGEEVLVLFILLQQINISHYSFKKYRKQKEIQLLATKKNQRKPSQSAVVQLVKSVGRRFKVNPFHYGLLGPVFFSVH